MSSERTRQRRTKDEKDNIVARRRAADATGIWLTYPEGMATAYWDGTAVRLRNKKVMTAKQEIENNVDY